METPKKWDVMTVGDVFLDLVMTGVRAWPQPGEEGLAKELRREIGGGAAITACGLSRLDQRVALMAMIGKDADYLVERLSKFGVTSDALLVNQQDSSGLTVSISTTQDRAFFTYPGANSELQPLLLTNPSVRKSLTGSRHVHLALPAMPALISTLSKALREAGVTLSLDAGWQPQWLGNHRNLQALGEVDLFMTNEREAELMTKQSEPEMMMRVFAKAGLRGVVLKLGERGSMLMWENEIYSCPAAAAKPRDTTGAGECFNAGFLYAWMAGGAPMQWLQSGNVCSALSTQQFGGVEGLPTPRQLKAARLKAYKKA
ncbi:MAG: carbohydrate kinase family protein [Acidobacteriota bacterium]